MALFLVQLGKAKGFLTIENKIFIRHGDWRLSKKFIKKNLELVEEYFEQYYKKLP